MQLEDNVNNDLNNNKDINIDNTYDKYIKMMIDKGYINNYLEPMKCPYCNSNDLEDKKMNIMRVVGQLNIKSIVKIVVKNQGIMLMEIGIYK